MRGPALMLAAFLLAGCGGNSIGDALDSRRNAGPCPPVGTLYEASRIVELDGAGENFSNITYTGEITDVRVFCRYVDDNPLEAELEIDFAFGKGPQARSDSHTYGYFIAVTRRNGKVLNKQYFGVDANFAGERVDGRSEVISGIVIPRADETISGANFEIVVGFDLSPEQLQFNRDGRRYRLDAAQ